MKSSVLGFMLASAVLLTAAAASAQDVAAGLAGLNERCVECHPTVFKEGLEQKFSHGPFFDRQCAACHVTESYAAAVRAQSASFQITGELVSQEPRWTKRTRLPAPEERTPEHRAVLQNLEPAGIYRFRLVVNPVAQEPGEVAVRGPWVGLAPAGMPGGAPLAVVDLAQKVPEGVVALSLQVEGQGAVSLDWQTSSPVSSWVEVEPLDAPGVAGPTEPNPPEVDPAAHPPLRDPEELTIGVCDSCHPASTQGTPHPVRVYPKRGSTEVPEDLPTLQEGMVTCATCHAPHGAPGRPLLRATVVTKLCVSCHLNFKGTSRNTMY
ncbi:MAG: hypothetical protein IH608_02700 [Proteobacteria bacterium]|nr:hypothetical protein [Pseudomonadota bacterium]